MIKRIIQYLSEHRAINFLLVAAYVGFIVFAHETFVNLSVAVMDGLSLPVYDRVVATISALVVVGLLLLIYGEFKARVSIDKVGVVFTFLTLCALIVHFFVFTEMNIEFIHAMEFGLLGVLIYPLVGRFGAAIMFAFPVMVFDEWYQYQVLYPETVEYFDFNDIQLDLLGAGLFLSLIKTFRFGLSGPLKHFFKRPELYITLIRIVVVVLLLSTSVIAQYPHLSGEHTLLVLNEIQEPYGFWRVHPLIGSIYHVLEPIPGLISVFGICLAYLALDPIRSAK